MKTRNTLNPSTIFLFVAIAFVVMGFNNYPKGDYKFSKQVMNNYKDSTIVGTWKCEADSLWKLTFTSNNLCYDYQNGILDNTFNYSISNTTPQCEEDVPVDSTTSYLKLTSVTDTTYHICYVINGITDSILSISPVWTGGVIIFDRQ